MDEKQNFQELLKLLVEFKTIYDKEKAKLPYHINVIDELHAGENAHSRILGKLLKQKEPTNKNFEILESFITYIIEKYSDKEEFQKINIKKPEITQEKERIDLWVRDADYAIVIENKVAWAGDQKKQLERYIDITKEHKKEEQIYVLYLPSTYAKDPDEQTWGKYLEGDIYKNRYLKLSFKDDILNWLKEKVLPEIKLKNVYLRSAVEQYIDHLEGKFSLRTINNKMNMELQEFIKDKLDLANNEPDKNLKILFEKTKEMADALVHLNKLKECIKNEYYEKWKQQLQDDYLKKDFPKAKILKKKDDGVRDSIGIQFNEIGDFSFSIGYRSDKNNIYYGIKRNTEDNKQTPMNIEIMQDFQPTLRWYGLKGTTFEKAYEDLKNLIENFIAPNRAVEIKE